MLKFFLKELHRKTERKDLDSVMLQKYDSGH